MKQAKVVFAEVIFPLVPLVVGIHLQSAAFVVAALLTFVCLYSIAYGVIAKDNDYEPFIPIFPLVGALAVFYFFYQVANPTLLQKILVLVAFVANYLITFPLATQVLLKRDNNKLARSILGILMSTAGLATTVVLLLRGMEPAAALALISTTMALPYPPKRKGGKGGNGTEEVNEGV
jgi:hypothetical protein